MSIRQFLTTTQDASAGRRADAASALARAYLHGELAPEAAAQARTALLALLDDSSTLVRRALAEACAVSAQAPRPLIVALASDHPYVAAIVLARSPVLTDADLVDCAAVGCGEAHRAIAGRCDLSKPVAAALAEVAGPEALVVLAENFHAAIGTAAFLRMIERHGDDADLRDALMKRDDVAIEVKQTIAARAAASFAAYSLASGWVGPERCARMTREAREAATLSLSDEAGEAGLARLVAHLRKQGELNAGLILRAILSLRMPFAEAALADLSGTSRARVAGLMFEPNGAGFAALHHKAGLPPVLLPVVQAALTTWRATADGRSRTSDIALARRMIESAHAASESLPFAEGRALVALLARFEAEAAREEARLFAQAAVRGAVEDADVPMLLGPGERVGAALWPEARPAEPVAALPAAERAESRTDFPVAAILDELPGAIVASYRAEERRRREAEAASVLDSLADALAASVIADRPAIENRSSAAGDARPGTARPRAIAVALAASMMPQAGQPDRTQLAA